MLSQYRCKAVSQADEEPLESVILNRPWPLSH
jgi:hypothetical protein